MDIKAGKNEKEVLYILLFGMYTPPPICQKYGQVTSA